MIPNDLTFTCVDRFLKYTGFDTQSSEESTTFPSTEKQKILGAELVKELLAMGLADAQMDENGYVTATIPATSPKAGVPVIGLIAHMDTSPEVTGANVKPIVHRSYAGGDIRLPADPSIAITVADNPDLRAKIGEDIITADGTTLLGADNKAGIAEIFDAAQILLDHPGIAHGVIRICITPDEEVGQGTKFFDVGKFGAQYAYTIDGEHLGDVENETFSADSMTFLFKGKNIHPGYAKNKLINSIKIAAEFIGALPKGALSPETTEKREGYVHPYVLNGGIEETSIKFLIRDFTVEGLKEKETMLDALARRIVAGHPGADVAIKIEESYRNMVYVLEKHPRVIEYAMEAIRRIGVEPRLASIRGGTDGARLSYMGIPTPNIFAGEHSFHSKREWVSIQDMQQAVRTILHLVSIWEEKS